LLKRHIGLVERVLLARTKIASSAGHKVNIGTPREAFIHEFLEDHLSSRILIGAGEVIDHDSKPGDARSQLDIVLYSDEYPVISLGGGVSAFLAESVIATIEVKSKVDQAAIEQAARAAREVKRLKRSVTTVASAGYQPPGILSFLLAYDGSANMLTTFNLMAEAHHKLGIADPTMPGQLDQRMAIASPALDGIFVLGRGSILFDNSALGVNIPETVRAQGAPAWLAIQQPDEGALFNLFMILTVAVSGFALRQFHPGGYLKGFKWDDARFAGVARGGTSSKRGGRQVTKGRP